MLLVAACSSTPSFRPPDSLDFGTYEKVDRTVENRLMGRAVVALQGLGLVDAFGASYEFLPHKPQFFFGAGKGSADRQALIDAELPLFGGGNGVTEPPSEVAGDGVTFLCAPYSHTGVPGTVGTGGLASIAAVCTWSDGETAGFGIGVAGPSVDDVAGMTDEARGKVVG
jgi:hypothetical protein